MLETLNSIDAQVFLFLNGFHSDFWDPVMWQITKFITWIPLYLVILYLVFKKFKWKGLWILLFIVIVVTLTDMLSFHAFKKVFQRLRPCHDPSLAHLVHMVGNKCGGYYGFISSHASNAFGVAVFSAFLLKQRWVTALMISWAFLIAYSRIYLGAHFPGDVLCAALLGTVVG